MFSACTLGNKYKLFLLFLSIASNLFPCSDVYDTLRSVGFLEIENRNLLRKDYTKLYQEYDKFIDLMNTDKSFFGSLIQSESDFISNPEHSIRYCGAPPSFRDPSIHTKKINNRIYFQYIKEHFDLIKQKYADVMIKSSIFFNYLDITDQVAKKHFTHILSELESDCASISKEFYRNNKDLTVVTKIVRYKKNVDWHEKPHFDKSGLTIILDNDDNHQSLMLCKDTVNPSCA